MYKQTSELLAVCPSGNAHLTETAGQEWKVKRRCEHRWPFGSDQ